jgi:protoporphyrinogen oxidase
MAHRQVVILGAGVTGLAAGIASGLPVYEGTRVPGGICASYYVVPGEQERRHCLPPHGDAYRFEIGGGHWLWGGDPLVLRFIRCMTPLKSYTRKAAVYLSAQDIFVPYPIQNHLCHLDSRMAMQVLQEILKATPANCSIVTMAEWLRAHFGQTLCQLFFNPFHEHYTAGLWQSIAPQDASKSPLNLSLVLEGAFDKVPQAAGYNVNFLYPIDGLNMLCQRMAQQCNIYYGWHVVRIDVKEKTLFFDDGASLPYKGILSTLPLDTMAQMAGLAINSEPDPFTSVMVVNIGARRGPGCPQEHWVYIPQSTVGFHRVGFYSNVDPSFLPFSVRRNQDHVGIYVEKAYSGGQRPSETETAALCQAIVQELLAWGWIEDVEVVDPTWINTAYTWFWPNSQWTQEAMAVLEAHDIYQVGRYARWASRVTDQGIAESLREGLFAGASFQGWT